MLVTDRTQLGYGSGRRQHRAEVAPKKLTSSGDGGDYALALSERGMSTQPF